MFAAFLKCKDWNKKKSNDMEYTNIKYFLLKPKIIFKEI